MGGVDSILGHLLVSEHGKQERKRLTCRSSDCIKTCQVRVKVKGDAVYRPEQRYPEKEVDEALSVN